MSLETSTFFIPEKSGQSLYKSRNSKFIGIAEKISSTDAAKERLKEIRTQYKDATHVCYAWILGNKGEIQMAADAGEPAHSAGTPILNAIRAAGLVWTLVAVVRYYGGSKLGVPGLIEAYGEAASLALLDAGIKEEVPSFQITINFHYDSIPLVDKIINQFEAEILSKEFQENCLYCLAIPQQYEEECLRILFENSNRIQIKQRNDSPQ